MSQVLDASITILLLRCASKWYGYIERSVIDIYSHSQTHKLLSGPRTKLKTYSRYSFLGRITEIKQTSSVVLVNSCTVQSLINFYKRWKNKMFYYLRDSLSTELAKDTKKELYFSPVRIISLIIVTTIVVNGALSFILQKQIDLWGWLIQGLFLFAGISGLFCQVDWPTVKSSSIFLKRIR